MSLERDLELIYELGCIRFIDRVWKQILSPDFANLAEHHFRVAWIALLLAKHEGKGDHEKILKMALVHDITESRTGDVHYISRLYTTRNEELAIKDMLKDTSFLEEFLELWEEYEKRESIESRIVKDADTLDVDLELHEQAAKGDTLESQLRPLREQKVAKELFTESAKKIWQAIGSSNVHDWHLHARNRHTAGDWKIES